MFIYMSIPGGAGTDLCVLGGAGSGKTTVARAFGALLGYGVSTIHCFADMTSRDLLQRRGTDETGATRWESTALVRAAVLGELAILDGTHRTPSDVLAILQRLIHDRELELFDGSRLMRHDRYDALLASGMVGDVATMTGLGLYRVHPAFRVVAVGEPPSATSANWLTSELLACFTFHLGASSAPGHPCLHPTQKACDRDSLACTPMMVAGPYPTRDCSLLSRPFS